MKPKTIVITVFVCLVFIALLAFGYPGQEADLVLVQSANGPESVGGRLTAPETLYDFGTISMRNGNVTKEFTVTNPTDGDVFVSSLATSCMCTKAFIVKPDGSVNGPFGMPGMGYVPPANETIKAGESRIIRVVYDPNAHGPAGVGQIDRFITLTDGAGSKVKLEIKALVTP